MAKTPAERPLRGALLGAGSISIHHLRAWRLIPNLQIVAIANRTRERALALGRQFGVEPDHIYSDYLELLDNEDLDFVDIATAPAIHREQTLAAAQRGLHVLCQKPFATSLTEAEEMIAACDAGGVRCIVHENWRWRRWFREIKTMLDAGVIGRPRYARLQARSAAALPRRDGSLPALLAQQPYTTTMPQFILLEWGLHLIDVLRFLFGEMRSVYARMSRVSPLVQGEDMAVVIIEFAGGLTALLDISWGTYSAGQVAVIRGSVDPFVVEGDRGVIELASRQGDDTMTIVTADGAETRPVRPGITRAEAYQESYFNTFAAFVQALRSGEPAENEARDNLKCLQATFAAYESAERNAVVVLPQTT